jgi:hypothetical protein
MKKMIVGLIAVGCFLTLATVGRSQELSLYMSVEPAHPIVGEQVVWRCVASGGDGNYTYVWNSGGFEHSTAVTNVYSTSGTKSVTVEVDDGTKWVSRTLSIEVSDGRLTLLYPNGGQVWEVGKTYLIEWKTEGTVDQVQIGLWDYRYNNNGSSNNVGEDIIAFSIQNTNSFYYTVPPPDSNGISAGNLWGRNYRITVGGFGEVVPDVSDRTFVITTVKNRNRRR